MSLLHRTIDRPASTCFVFHIIISNCISVDNAAAQNAAAATAGTGAVNEETVPAISWPPETFEASGDEDSLMGLTNNGCVP